MMNKKSRTVRFGIFLFGLMQNGNQEIILNSSFNFYFAACSQ